MLKYNFRDYNKDENVHIYEASKWGEKNLY